MPQKNWFNQSYFQRCAIYIFSFFSPFSLIASLGEFSMVAQVMSGQYHPPGIQRHDKGYKNETDLVLFTFQKKTNNEHTKE